MALVKGTNSYVTVAEANSYFENRLHSESWDAASESVKAKALVTATKILDQYSWEGEAEDELQPLAFPRVGYYFEPRLNMIIDLRDVPNRVIEATYELALHLMDNDVQAASSSVKSLRVGPISLENITTSKTPSSVTKLVKPLLINSGSQSWWRSN